MTKQEITPSETKELKEALISAFPLKGSLEQMVYYRLEQGLNVIAGGQNDSEVVFNLIRWAEANGQIEALIKGARAENKGNRDLIKFEEQYNLRRSILKVVNLSPSAVPFSLLDLEALPFRNLDQRLSQEFFTKALDTGRGVVRLQVPRVFNGKEDGKTCYGTGWLIAPGLLITNCHVIAARCEEGESQEVSADDLHQQVEGSVAWFDYRRAGKQHLECQGATLVHYNPKWELDYALIRLKEKHKIVRRQPLHLVKQQPTLQHGERLNIIQHSGGGPLLYAIRNNFFITNSSITPSLLHYLTETEPGASGSPVLGDDWLVRALHHASLGYEQTYDLSMQGRLPQEVARFRNEGIAIHSVLADLPTEVRQEIKQAQGWGS